MTYEELINEINEKITENGAGEITGAVLNEVLTAVVQAVTDNTARKLVTIAGIQNLTQQQLEDLNVGDIVVDVLPRNPVAYNVTLRGSDSPFFVYMCRVDEASIKAVKYREWAYFDTVTLYFSDFVLLSDYNATIEDLQRQINELKNQ